MDWTRILAYITGSVDQELLLRNEYLAAENRILRAQLNGWLRLSDAERATLGEIGFRLGRKALSEVATVARPDTILAWHRRLIARKFEGFRARRARGRPRIDREVEGLIIRMAEENRSWGYDRIAGALANLGHEVSDQTVGNVLRRNGISPAPERKRRTTWAEFIRIHLALLAGTDISAAEVLMRGSVTCYMLFFIYLESSRIDISRITNGPNKPWKLRVTRNVRIPGRSTRPRCHALQDRDTINFTFFQAIRAPLVRSVSVGAEKSMVAPANECLSKVIFFGDRSSHPMTKSHTERNHQEKSTISLLRQIADKRCEEAARSRERRDEPHKLDRGKVALGPPPLRRRHCIARLDSRALAAAARSNTINRFFIKNGNGDAATA
jgi:putative transposase